MSKWLHGVHDIDGSELMGDRSGWITITEAIGSDPHDHSGRDYSQWTQRGFSILCRLNNGYSPAGTIPHSNYYEDFARRCGNFVRNTSGITVAIIGNEPNHRNERPNGENIIPTQYAKCFDLCYEQIQKTPSPPQVAIAAVAPWDATTTYPGNEIGDWIIYYFDILQAIKRCDAICLHTYTHGSDPLLITDSSKMDPPFQKRHYNFRAYTDFLYHTPAEFTDLPIYITETDQVHPWVNRNEGWIQEAYEEIDFWNHTVEDQKIHCLCIYRSNKDDQWSFANKDQVKEDFRQAVGRGYVVPAHPSYPPINPPNPINPPPIDADLPRDRNIDPTLIARGVKFDLVTPPKGVGYWAIVNALHLNEEEADTVGPDHHILGTIKKDGREISDIPLRVWWSGGNATVISKKPQAIASYNYDYPMSSSLNEFSIMVNEPYQSDMASGIGMGEHGNPSIHTSTWIDWEWKISEGSNIPIPPIPPIIPPIPPITPDLKLAHPLPDSVITQHFYQNPDNYARFNIPGHNGTDLGGRLLGAPVLSIADGIIAFSDFDPDYGNYVRIRHGDDRMMCYTMYCHLAEPGALEGVTVKAGQQIGRVGSTGNSTGVHLHLEIRLMNKDGTYREGVSGMGKGRVDPETFLVERGLRL
jgi:hypothetical protein